MTVAYFDCFSGVSGDMLLGALVDAGLDAAALQAEVDRLEVGAVLRCSEVMRCGLRATRVVVEFAGRPVTTQSERHLDEPTRAHQQVGDDEGHGHRHDHDHANGHGPRGDQPHRHGDGPGHTHLADIAAVIEGSRLDDEVKAVATSVFRRLAEAEAEVHGADVDAVALHEVGSLDAIVDIAGTIAGLRLLGVRQVLASPLHCGTGTVECAHGRFPVPVPGVLVLCRGVPLVQTAIAAELITPTGAALITTLATGYGPAPALTLGAVGHGAGARDLPATPNVVRLRLGEPLSAAAIGSRCVLLEANLDDMNPEVFGYLFERLLEAGARDVYVTAVLMKKGRPGHLLSVLTDPGRLEAIADLVLAETTTLGVRYHEVDRRLLERSSATVATAYGPVRLKVAAIGALRRFAPEYDDCAAVARSRGVPILTVYAAAIAAARQGYDAGQEETR